jgi:hypothetical protein
MQFVIAESAGDSLLAFEQHLSTADSAPQPSEAPNSIAGKAVENRGTTAAITKAANKTSTKRANQEAIAKDCPCSGSAARGTRIVDIGLRTRSPHHSPEDTRSARQATFLAIANGRRDCQSSDRCSENGG